MKALRQLRHRTLPVGRLDRLDHIENIGMVGIGGQRLRTAADQLPQLAENTKQQQPFLVHGSFFQQIKQLRKAVQLFLRQPQQQHIVGKQLLTSHFLRQLLQILGVKKHHPAVVIPLQHRFRFMVSAGPVDHDGRCFQHHTAAVVHKPAGACGIHQDQLLMVMHVVGCHLMTLFSVYLHMGNALGFWPIEKLVNLHKIPPSQ